MTADIRWKQRLDNLQRAVALLREPFARDIAALSALEQEGTIKRFESAFELAWLTLKDLLQHAGSPIQVPLGSNSVMKAAIAAGLLRDDPVWNNMRLERNALAHRYDGEAAQRAMVAIRDQYLPACEQLCARLVALAQQP
jgi:nucleotidyltransferase substrate binding protein (TIGR01987 family)